MSSVALAMRPCSRHCISTHSNGPLSSYPVLRGKEKLSALYCVHPRPGGASAVSSSALVLRSGCQHSTLGTGSLPPWQLGCCSRHRPRGTRHHNHHTEPRPLCLLGAGCNKGLHRAPCSRQQGAPWRQPWGASGDGRGDFHWVSAELCPHGVSSWAPGALVGAPEEPPRRPVLPTPGEPISSGFLGVRKGWSPLPQVGWEGAGSVAHSRSGRR